jgi:hypothetical protein
MLKNMDLIGLLFDTRSVQICNTRQKNNRDDNSQAKFKLPFDR